MTDKVDGQDEKLESIAPEVHQSTLEELEATKQKLEVAKSFLQELDTKVSKYEALNIDELVDSLERFESLGSLEELTNLVQQKSESESEEDVEKSTSDDDSQEEEDAVTDEEKKCPECESTDYKKVDGKMVCGDCGHEEVISEAGNDNEVSDEESTPATESSVEELPDSEKVEMDQTQAELLAQYQALGTVDSIKTVFENHDNLIDNFDQVKVENDELTSQNGELTEKLESYVEIGTPAEILDVCTSYADIKTKMEAERIAGELDLPLEKVESTIEKMESVQEAEDLLTELFPKVESDEENDGSSEESDADKDAEGANEATDAEADAEAGAEEDAAADEATDEDSEKSESEDADIVDGDDDADKVKNESELNKLAQICAKL